MSREKLSIYDEPSNLSEHLAVHGDLVQSCEEKAKAAGKLEDYRDAMNTYSQFIPNRGALALMALARVGVEVAALETLFLMREQEHRDQIDKSMRELTHTFGGVQAARSRQAGGYYWAETPAVAPSPMPLGISRDYLVSEAQEWADRGYTGPVPGAIEAMRTAGVSAREFADLLTARALTKKTP